MSVERMVITPNQACQLYFDLTACTIIMAVCATTLYTCLESHLRCRLPKNFRKLRCKTPLRHRYLPRNDIDALSTKKNGRHQQTEFRIGGRSPYLTQPAGLLYAQVSAPTSQPT